MIPPLFTLQWWLVCVVAPFFGGAIVVGLFTFLGIRVFMWSATRTFQQRAKYTPNAGLTPEQIAWMWTVRPEDLGSLQVSSVKITNESQAAAFGLPAPPDAPSPP